MKVHLSNGVRRVLVVIGSICTFAVGCVFVYGAACLFNDFVYDMGLQVAPSSEKITGMILQICAFAFLGIVLIFYSISDIPSIGSGGDDS